MKKIKKKMMQINKINIKLFIITGTLLLIYPLSSFCENYRQDFEKLKLSLLFLEKEIAVYNYAEEILLNNQSIEDDKIKSLKLIKLLNNQISEELKQKCTNETYKTLYKDFIRRNELIEPKVFFKSFKISGKWESNDPLLHNYNIFTDSYNKNLEGVYEVFIEKNSNNNYAGTISFRNNINKILTVRFTLGNNNLGKFSPDNKIEHPFNYLLIKNENSFTIKLESKLFGNEEILIRIISNGELEAEFKNYSGKIVYFQRISL